MGISLNETYWSCFTVLLLKISFTSLKYLYKKADQRTTQANS